MQHRLFYSHHHACVACFASLPFFRQALVAQMGKAAADCKKLHAALGSINANRDELSSTLLPAVLALRGSQEGVVAEARGGVPVAGEAQRWQACMLRSPAAALAGGIPQQRVPLPLLHPRQVGAVLQAVGERLPGLVSANDAAGVEALAAQVQALTCRVDEKLAALSAG